MRLAGCASRGAIALLYIKFIRKEQTSLPARALNGKYMNALEWLGFLRDFLRMLLGNYYFLGLL